MTALPLSGSSTLSQRRPQHTSATRRRSRCMVLENVVMHAMDIQDNITKLLGVKPQVANANLWAACDRDRNFWSSHPSVPTPRFGAVEPEIP